MTDMSDHPPAVVVMSTTCPDVTVAQTVARELVARRLAACVQMAPIRSVYRWDGAVVEDSEVSVTAKTTTDRVERAMATVRETHPYDLPEIVVGAPLDGDAEYLEWVVGECTG